MSDSHSDTTAPGTEQPLPGVSLDALKKRRDELNAGIAQLSAQLQQGTGQLNRMTGAVAVLDELINGASDEAPQG